MIKTLYPIFRSRWSERGGVWILSDTHFEDSDCKLMDKNWITPQEQIDLINGCVGKYDAFIHLGDIGNPEWMRKVRGYKVAILGNHDRGASCYTPYFDEVYDGPLFIAEKIVLSHEPLPGIEYALNIHGHDHSGKHTDKYHLNLAANVRSYKPLNLGKFIKAGGLSGIDSLHRLIIDDAAGRSQYDEIV